jgi:hypothetical protein
MTRKTRQNFMTSDRRCALQAIVRARTALQQGRRSPFFRGPKPGVMDVGRPLS